MVNHALSLLGECNPEACMSSVQGFQFCACLAVLLSSPLGNEVGSAKKWF